MNPPTPQELAPIKLFYENPLQGRYGEVICYLIESYEKKTGDVSETGIANVRKLQEELKWCKETIATQRQQIEELHGQNVRLIADKLNDWYDKGDSLQQEKQLILGPKREQNFLKLALLGKGGCGAVWLCYNLRTLERVACKLVKGFSNREQIVSKWMQQKAIDHHNIVKVLDVFTSRNGYEEECVVFVLEHVQGPNLRQYLTSKGGKLDEQEVVYIAHSVLSALLAIENSSPSKKRLVHLDLHPGNILLSSNELSEGVKIADFGLAKRISADGAHNSQKYGSPLYMPPEWFDKNKEKVYPKNDIWSVGCICYELLTGHLPFGLGMTEEQINQRQHFGELKFDTGRASLSQPMKDFIGACLTCEHAARPDFAELLEYELFRTLRPEIEKMETGSH